MANILKINKDIGYKINYKVRRLFRSELPHFVPLHGNFSTTCTVTLGEYKCSIHWCRSTVDVLFLFIGISLFDRYPLTLNAIGKHQPILSQL